MSRTAARSKTMNIRISTDDLLAELRKRMESKCVCESRTFLPQIEAIYLDVKAKAEKEIPLSCIE